FVLSIEEVWGSHETPKASKLRGFRSINARVSGYRSDALGARLRAAAQNAYLGPPFPRLRAFLRRPFATSVFPFPTTAIAPPNGCHRRRRLNSPRRERRRLTANCTAYLQ